MPKVNEGKKFDVDLSFGEDAERWVAWVFEVGGKRVECKAERDWWLKTGNIVFEVSCRGRASGLKTTLAHWWAQVLTHNGMPQGMVVFNTSLLLYNLRRLYSQGRVKLKSIGDDNASLCVVVPIAMIGELFVPLPVGGK